MKTFLGKYSWENIFYLLCSWLILSNIYLMPPPNLELAVWLFPFNIVPIESPQVFMVWLYALGVALLFFALVPVRGAPFFVALIWFFWLTLANSFDKIIAIHFGYFMAMFGICVAYVSGKKQLSLTYSVAAATYIYMSSGLWKLRNIFGSEYIYEASRTLTYNIAFGQAENFNTDRIPFLKFFADHYYVSAAFWIFIICTQILTPLGIIFFERWRIPLLIILIIFHMAGKIIVGPAFEDQIRLLLMFISIYAFRMAEPYWKSPSEIKF